MATLLAAANAKSTTSSMNPPFHKNILNIFGQNTATGPWEPLNIYRGAIILKDGSKGVRFLYNPSQVDLQHSLSPDQTPSDVGGGTTNLGTNIALDSGTLSFSLLFDRTYELWHDKKNLGVLVDVRAVYAMVGIIDSIDSAKPEDIHPMSPNPAYVYLGQSGTTLLDRATTAPLSYYGWINSLTVTYTHWSVNMIPMRCVIGIGFRLYPQPDAGSTGGGAGSPTGTGGASGGPSGANQQTTPPGSVTPATPPPGTVNPFPRPGLG